MLFGKVKKEVKMDSDPKKLSDLRKGEIALIIINRIISGDIPIDSRGLIRLNSDSYKRSIGNMAAILKDDGVSKEELEALFESMVRDSVDKMFAKKSKK